MTQGLQVRRATSQDIDWILDLIERNQRDNVAPGKQASQGFIQGHFSAESVGDRLAGPGGWVAQIDGRRAGVILSSAPDIYPHGAPGRTVEVARAALPPGTRFLLYGPVVVEDAFRRHGVLRALARRLFIDTADSFDEAVAFVEEANEVSTTVHGRLGFRAIGTFTLDGRSYAVLAHPTGPAT